uniref:Integrase catalytic domain-containing protein n=1 Tax=Bursaphelenchus xylophilus TaxID=6326 RepID=A0A1I7S8G4_BURXY
MTFALRQLVLWTGFVTVIAIPPSLPSSKLAFQQENYENAAPAWYQMPERPENPYVNTRSPYGPQPDKHTFVPVPSPFELPRPRTPLEMANGHIVDAAQEPHINGFFRTLNGQVTNLERYMPLLAKKLGVTTSTTTRTTTPRPTKAARKSSMSSRSRQKASSTERPYTRRGLGNVEKCWDCSTVTVQLVTATPMATPMSKRKLKIVKKPRNNRVTTKDPWVIELTKEPKEKWPSMQVTTKDHWNRFTIATRATTSRPQESRQVPKGKGLSKIDKNGKEIEENETAQKIGEKSKSTGKLTQAGVTVTPEPPEEHTDVSTNTKIDVKTKEYTKLTVSGKSSGSGRPDMILETKRTVKNGGVLTDLKGPLEMLNKAKNGWTHKENRPKIDCPESNVSPIEVAIVWASTELIEAIKEALSKFRSTLTARQMAHQPEPHADIADLGRELENTWTQLKDSGFLERAVAELALSDPQISGHEGIDTDAAARKIDELWREAMLASAVGQMTEPDPINRPMYDDVRGYEQPKREMPVNCHQFSLLCKLLRPFTK